MGTVRETDEALVVHSPTLSDAERAHLIRAMVANPHALPTFWGIDEDDVRSLAATYRWQD